MIQYIANVSTQDVRISEAFLSYVKPEHICSLYNLLKRLKSYMKQDIIHLFETMLKAGISEAVFRYGFAQVGEDESEHVGIAGHIPNCMVRRLLILATRYREPQQKGH